MAIDLRSTMTLDLGCENVNNFFLCNSKLNDKFKKKKKIIYGSKTLTSFSPKHFLQIFGKYNINILYRSRNCVTKMFHLISKCQQRKQKAYYSRITRSTR